jgi:hypothetical protein
MMARAILHGVSTVAGLATMQMVHHAPLWLRMALYAISWIACAAAYLPILYLREQVVDAWDAHTRRVVRDELDRLELLAYQQRVERDRAREPDRDDGAAGPR